MGMGRESGKCRQIWRKKDFAGNIGTNGEKLQRDPGVLVHDSQRQL